MVTQVRVGGEVRQIETGNDPWDVMGSSFTVTDPEFLPDGTIKGVVNENKLDQYTVLNGNYRVHPMNILGAIFPMVLIRWNGRNWVGTEGVKSVILSAGKIFGIK
jgi:hypothetical protein